MEEPKTKMYLIVSFILNFCLTFTLIWTVSILFIVGYLRVPSTGGCLVGGDSSQKTLFNNLKDNPDANVASDDTDSGLGADDTVPQETWNIEQTVDVNDSGFLTKGFYAPFGYDVKLTVMNSGMKPHSFVLEDFSVDTGDIAPGASKVVDFKLPNDLNSRMQEKVYNFYSGSDGDKANGFGGVLIISE